MKTLADRIIAARKAKNWTQADLAKALRVNVKNISRWELGQAKPSIEAAAELATALNVSLDYLGGMTGTDTASPLEQLLKHKLKRMSDARKKALKTILDAF